MPTASATFGTQFPAHSVNTSTAVSGVLKNIIGRDTQYGPNKFSVGYPVKVAYDTSALNVTLTLDTYGTDDWATGKTYYVVISTTKYETTNGGTCYYDTVAGLTTRGTFSTTQRGSYNSYGARTETVTVTYDFKANTQYYLYIHFGSPANTSLYHVTGISATYEYNGIVRIYTSNGWVNAIPYVYTSNGWQ